MCAPATLVSEGKHFLWSEMQARLCSTNRTLAICDRDAKLPLEHLGFQLFHGVRMGMQLYSICPKLSLHYNGRSAPFVHETNVLSCKKQCQAKCGRTKQERNFPSQPSLCYQWNRLIPGLHSRWFLSCIHRGLRVHVREATSCESGKFVQSSHSTFLKT